MHADRRRSDLARRALPRGRRRPRVRPVPPDDPPRRLVTWPVVVFLAVLIAVAVVTGW